MGTTWAPLWCGQTYNDTAARPPHTTLFNGTRPSLPYQSSGLSLFTLERLDNLGLHGEKWWTMAISNAYWRRGEVKSFLVPQ
ncbi:hypothetical protein CDAR_605491 [Caerostris darwini]|uniref:Uncharacterized protein n=1 Tax=Caerostris darwini TaxID=1538125 RepID=A0AAV4R8W4_9ARAC|nr:hypothetical protein CDAR_605491 [Caerostris darwini]